MSVVLLRHGQTAWSESGQHTGNTDIPLTDAGREQARAAAERLPVREFAHVLVSPRQRAQETADLAGIGAAKVTVDELHEWDYGDYEGLTTDEVHAQRPDWFLWTDGCPNGESPQQVTRRVDALIERVRALDGDVALVAHGHVLRAIGARWVGAGILLGGQLRLGTAAVCELDWEHGRPAIDHWNLT